MRNRIRSLRSDEGQAVVELALAIPLLLLVLFAIIQFGEAINNYNDATNLANIAARYATVGATPSCTSTTGTVTTTSTNVSSYVICQGSQQSSAFAGASTCVADAGASGSGTVSTVTTGDPLKVKVSVPFNLTANLPILGSFLPATITIASSATMRTETTLTTASYAFTPTVSTASGCP